MANVHETRYAGFGYYRSVSTVGCLYDGVVPFEWLYELTPKGMLRIE